MANISNRQPFNEREIFYFRQRYKNRVFQSVVAFFAAQAEERGLTKRELAIRLGKDPAQISRWLSGPGNWTLDTVSDLLLVMKAEMSDEIVRLDEDCAANKSASVDQSRRNVFYSVQTSGTTQLKKHG
jgi:Helix-turn-helix